jgi:flagellar biosynthesis/type III secretory pathway M-ring protein FliF/YscJ
MISSCIAKQTAALGLGVATLATAAPPDLVSAWEKGGMVVVCLVIVSVVWASSRRDAAKAEERRDAREAEMRKWREEDRAIAEARDGREQDRHEKIVEALTSLKAGISENAIRCDARREALEGIVRKANPKRTAKRKPK